MLPLFVLILKITCIDSNVVTRRPCAGHGLVLQTIETMANICDLALEIVNNINRKEIFLVGSMHSSAFVRNDGMRFDSQNQFPESGRRHCLL